MEEDDQHPPQDGNEGQQGEEGEEGGLPLGEDGDEGVAGQRPPAAVGSAAAGGARGSRPALEVALPPPSPTQPGGGAGRSGTPLTPNSRASRSLLLAQQAQGGQGSARARVETHVATCQTDVELMRAACPPDPSLVSAAQQLAVLREALSEIGVVGHRLLVCSSSPCTCRRSEPPAPAATCDGQTCVRASVLHTLPFLQKASR